MAFQQYNIYAGLTPVRLVATSNQSGTYYNGPLNNGVGATLTYATGALSIDSVVVAVGDRVALVAQTNANENGIYVCTVAGAVGVAAVLKRAADLQCIEQVRAGMWTSVGAGTANGGSFYSIVEPLPAIFGVDDLAWESAATPGGGSQSFTNIDVSGIATIANNGLHVLDTDSSHDLILRPASNLTADRILSLITGDAARTIDISAASLVLSAFGATVIDDATNLAALTTLGVKRGTTAAYGGGGTSNAFVATGLVATDIVVAQMLNSTNNVAVTQAVPTADTLTVRFSADPGAATTVSWIAIPTV